jgi:hypothetical protein
MAARVTARTGLVWTGGGMISHVPKSQMLLSPKLREMSKSAVAQKQQLQRSCGLESVPAPMAWMRLTRGRLHLR